MTRRKLVALVSAAFVAAIFVWVLATLPPRQRRLDDLAAPRPAGPEVVGVLHVHTDRSDGTGSVDEVAAAAARAGLQFVIVTDHGDGTRPPDPPAYRAGVLCLDGVEISTDGGHYLALDMPASPYPLGGEPRDVVEDVARLGGFGVVAHPVSGKGELGWRDWTAPFGALEWLNADSEWRDEPTRRLVQAFLAYAFRPAEAVASLLDRPALAFARWDALTARRRIVALAGSDAHARIGFGGGADAADDPALVEIPSYEQAFRTFAMRVEPDEPFSGDAGRDTAGLVRALRAGRVYTVIDAVATPAALVFRASSGGRTARMGDELPIAGPVEITAAATAPPGAELVLIRNGEAVRTERGGELRHAAPAEPAVFRVEVRVPGAPGDPPVPWIVGNPIYVGGVAETRAAAPPRPAPRTAKRLFTDGSADGWATERDATSQAVVDSTPTLGGRELAFRFALAGGPRVGQYVALVRAGVGGFADFDRLSFRARASRPMRLSVQIRLTGAGDQPRWQRSIYLDTMPRDVSVFFDELTPIGATPTRRPDLNRVQALLFVVDTVHARPGASGVVWLDDVRLEGSAGTATGPPNR